MIENLIWFYEQAQPDELAQADWYHVAHEQCKAAAHSLGIEFELFTKAVAALSPSLYWECNIKGVIDLATTGSTGYGYGQNRVKALAILGGDVDALRGPKVTRFADNLIDPAAHSHEVVVDMWAWRAWVGRVHGNKTLTQKEYDLIADDYREAAEIVGLEPSEFQAVVWVVARRLGKALVLENRRKAHEAKKQARVS